MKIFKVVFDVNNYKSLLASDAGVHEKRLLALDGQSKLQIWGESLAAEVDNRKGATPDIYDLGAGNMVLYSQSLELISKHLKSEFELLPVHWDEESGFCVNPLTLCNCINGNDSIWCVDEESGKRLFIEEHAFDIEKVPDIILFKDELECFELFTTDAAHSLKSLVEKHNLKGLSFELFYEA